ncbi:hypothetical protein H0H87_005798, partial [Tephrocybe sp. NHM501043]
MGFATLHAHKAKSSKHLVPRADFTPSAACLAGALYTSPTASASVDSLQPLTIQWDPSCLSPDTAKVDIHLIAPWYEGESTEIYSWLGIENKAGDGGKAQKQVTLMPKWWNATAEVRVQLAIVETGMLPGMTSLPAGPVWKATYTAPADGSVPASAQTDSST